MIKILNLASRFSCFLFLAPNSTANEIGSRLFEYHFEHVEQHTFGQLVHFVFHVRFESQFKQKNK